MKPPHGRRFVHRARLARDLNFCRSPLRRLDGAWFLGTRRELKLWRRSCQSWDAEGFEVGYPPGWLDVADHYVPGAAHQLMVTGGGFMSGASRDLPFGRRWLKFTAGVELGQHSVCAAG